jgi:hypothetical protein
MSFILKLHVTNEVDHHQAFPVNPQNQNKMLLFVRSLKYYKINILLQNIRHTNNTDNTSYD